jgi:hypothetical protein
MPRMSPLVAQILFWIAALICAAGEGAIIFAAVRRYDRSMAAYPEDRRRGSRRTRERWSPDRRTDGDPTHLESNALRDLVWAVIPGVALALLLAATWAQLPE